MFCIQNFGLSSVQDGLFLQTSRGFHEVNDGNIRNIITALPRADLISKTNLQKLLKSHVADEEYDDVLNYLIDVLGIVFETGLSPSTLSISASSERFAEIGRLFGYEISRQKTTPSADVHILLFDGPPDEEMVRRIIRNQPNGNRIVIGFQARNNYVISSVWSAGEGLPCPMCVVDFAHDRVFYDPKDSVMGLSDVYDLVRSLKAKEPHIPMGNAELAFILRYVTQYTDALTGAGFGGFTPFDPLMTSVIDFTALNRQLLRVPLSPLCACVQCPPAITETCGDNQYA